MLAIIETGGKQYLIESGKTLRVEKLPQHEGEKVVFDKVLLTADAKGSVRVGAPYLDGATVEATLEKQGRGRKIKMMRYKSKTRQRRRKGHRQHYSQVKVAA